MKENNKEKTNYNFNTYYKKYPAISRPITSQNPPKTKEFLKKRELKNKFLLTNLPSSPINTVYNTIYSDSKTKSIYAKKANKTFFGLDGKTKLPDYFKTNMTNFVKGEVDLEKDENEDNENLNTFTSKYNNKTMSTNYNLTTNNNNLKDDIEDNLYTLKEENEIKDAFLQTNICICYNQEI